MSQGCQGGFVGLFWNGTWHIFKRGIRIYVKGRLRKLWKEHDIWHFTMHDSVEFINIIFKNQDPLGEVSSTFLNA